jgi:hypothetical protein
MKKQEQKSINIKLFILLAILISSCHNKYSRQETAVVTKEMYHLSLISTDKNNTDTLIFTIFEPLTYKGLSYYPYRENVVWAPVKYNGIFRIAGNKWYRVYHGRLYDHEWNPVHSLDWLENESVWLDFDAPIGTVINFESSSRKDYYPLTLVEKNYKKNGEIEITLLDKFERITNLYGNDLRPLRYETFSNKKGLVTFKHLNRNLTSNGDSIVCKTTIYYADTLSLQYKQCNLLK